VATITVEYSATLNARPEQVYAVFRDYKVSHPAILPKPYFEYLNVDEGGLGAGTKFTAGMNIYGNKSVLVAKVSEPEPGRLIVERDDEDRIVTSFIMAPVENGQKTLTTLKTVAKTSGGFQGLIERFMMPSVLKMIYKKELANVEAYIAKQATR
jgi:hypothetical protein